ncbi:MAG: right-handed parallel beta-helix repeat-containing protein [Bacteroidota bacterium]
MMKIISLLTSLLLLLSFSFLAAQNVYVDATNGSDLDAGSEEAPFQSLAKAIQFANALTGSGSIRIKLNPGLYTLKGRLDINPVRILSDSLRYIIEASILPDDKDWTPAKMPVIQSISTNNSSTQFPHATAFLVASSHVSIRGLKFLGNAQPEVNYYYPISKEDMSLEDLEVSQCVFIGDKEAAKIQGGVWAHGPQNTISHCVFYGCRNGVLFFNNVEGFTIEHTIIYGAYESAFWFGPEDYDFTFTNNIIAHNACFLVGPQELKYSSPFANSIISDNQAFVAYWSREDQGVKSLAKPNISLVEVQKTANIELLENNAVKLAPNHLHLREDSEGKALKAGIFK